MASNPIDEVAVTQFYGGQASDEAIGIPSSFSYSQALEHRRNPSQLTVLPGLRKISASVVTDLILNMVQVQNGDRYAFGDTGKVYKISTANVVTNIGTLPTGTDGMSYRADTDAIYLATKTDVRRYAPLSGTPTFDQIYGASKSIDTKASKTGGASTYTLTSAITETAVNQLFFLPDIEPFYSFKVKIIDKGTGNWTLTLHDGLNTLLGSVTTLNANLVNGVLNEFIFSAPVRALVKPNARTYHVHLTSSNATGTAQVTTAGNLGTADYELWANRLVSTVNGFHPMAQFQQFTCIGNGRYLAVWEPLTDADPPNNEFQRHRLTFPPGYEVCGLAVTDEFLVIACGKYSTDGSKDYQEGKLFTWDGTATTYNQIIDVSGGTPESIQSHENYPYFFVNGVLCAWPGGKNVVKVRTIANTNTTYKNFVDNTSSYPNMMCVRESLLHASYPSTTNNAAIEQGTYVWGTLEKNFPSTFNYGYLPSHGLNLNTSGTLKLGCTRSFGDEMYLSWKNGSTYGLDILDNYCTPAPVFKFRARRFDAGKGYNDKQAIMQSLTTAALPTGVTLSNTYKIDNGTTQVQASMVTGATEVVDAIQQGNFKRIITGFDGTCTGTQTPIIYVQTLLYNPLTSQRSL